MPQIGIKLIYNISLFAVLNEFLSLIINWIKIELERLLHERNKGSCIFSQVIN